MYCICYLLVVQHVCNKLTASVRFVTCRESATDHKDMTFVDILLHLGYRPEYVIFGKVAEHAHADLGTGISPSLCRVVVTVCTREHRQICNRGLDRLTLIFKVSTFCLVWLDLLHSCRNKFLMISLGSIRIYLSELRSIGSNEFEDIELHTVDGEFALLSVCHLSDEDCIRIIQSLLRLNEDRAIAIIEEFLLIDLDLRIKTVSERHLADSLCKTAETERIGRNDIVREHLLMDIFPVGLELLHIRHIVVKRSMPDQIKLVAFVFEFRGYDLLGVNGGDTEGHEHRRDIDILERSAHGVLSSDRRKTEFDLHLQRSEKG